MDTFVILRRSGWKDGGARRSSGPLDRGGRADAGRHRLDPQLRARGARRPSRHRLHLRGSSPEAIRTHAGDAVLPVDEIVKVVDTLIVRPDPAAVAVR